MQKNSKESGVSLHITSLPGKYGIGTLGKECYKFIDYIKECGFSYWEILPLLDIGYSNSPFQVISAFGYNHFLIDFDLLIEDGLLNKRDLFGINFGDDPRHVDFRLQFLNKDKILKKAYKRFDKNDLNFIEFSNNQYIYRYALYKTIKEHNNYKAWFDFSLEDRFFDEDVEDHYLRHHRDEIWYQIFLQYIFNKQRDKLHQYAKERNIDLVGDLPHFVGYDSDCMYFNPELFIVDKRNQATVVAGFPPDNFNSQGQKWGYPLYDWGYMKLNNYKWWMARIDDALNRFDRVKLNHFRGFKEVYAIPFRTKNAKKGHFIPGPGLNFINIIKEKGELIASDLGTFSLRINEFVKESGLPCLRTLIPSLFDHISNSIIPSFIEENCYFYLGNHDNTPVKAKLESLDKKERESLVLFINKECEQLNVDKLKEPFSNYDIAYKLIELIFASPAKHVTFTFQDLLYKDKNSRMNAPGTHDNNWEYRFLSFEFDDELINKLKNLNKIYHR